MYKCKICGDEFERDELKSAFAHVVYGHDIAPKDVKYVLVPMIPARLSDDDLI